jgi:hypothetical protein
MVVDVQSIHELDELLEDLPIWPRMHTTVKQLIAFDDRIANVSSRLARIKGKMQSIITKGGSS